MPKEEWGVKRACPKCLVRFYDLQNDPMTCPSCGASFEVASLTQQRTRSASPIKEVIKPKPAPEPAPEDIEEAVVLGGDDDDDAAESLGDDLLDDDDDTVDLEEIAAVPASEDES